jgi:plasmid stability protein
MHNACMATLTVRNLPDGVMRSLRDLAARQGRSVEEQVRQLLAESVVDRMSAVELIEKAWTRQERATTAAEVDAWLRSSRP